MPHFLFSGGVKHRWLKKCTKPQAALIAELNILHHQFHIRRAIELINVFCLCGEVNAGARLPVDQTSHHN